MSTIENTALVLRYIQEVLNEGRMESVDAICATELLIHVPHFPAGVLRGRVVLKQLINHNRIVRRASPLSDEVMSASPFR